MEKELIVSGELTNERIVILIDTAIEVLQRGWCQHRLWEISYDDNGRQISTYCAEGAVRKAFELHYIWASPLNELWLKLSEVCREMHGLSLVCFNDEPGTTADDVIAVFEKARARFEEEV